MIKKQSVKPKITPRNAILCAAIVMLTVALDFISKQIVMSSMTVGESIPLIENVFHFTYITNDGAAFGAFSEHRAVFMSLSFVLLAVLTVLLIYWEPSPLFYVGASTVLGGGIGNMIDRIAYGTVVDFLDFCAFPSLWKWIFNLADAFVCIGAGILILYYIRLELENARRQKEAEESGDRESECDAVTSDAVTSDTSDGDAVKNDGIADNAEHVENTARDDISDSN